MQAFLGVWYLYMTVLAVLMTASAGPRSRAGAVAVVALLASGVLLYSVVRLPPRPELVLPGAGLATLGAALVLLAAARRQDTRLIALLLAGSAALPLYLYFWPPIR